MVLVLGPMEADKLIYKPIYVGLFLHSILAALGRRNFMKYIMNRAFNRFHVVTVSECWCCCYS